MNLKNPNSKPYLLPALLAMVVGASAPLSFADSKKVKVVTVQRPRAAVQIKLAGQIERVGQSELHRLTPAVQSSYLKKRLQRLRSIDVTLPLTRSRKATAVRTLERFEFRHPSLALDQSQATIRLSLPANELWIAPARVVVSPLGTKHQVIVAREGRAEFIEIEPMATQGAQVIFYSRQIQSRDQIISEGRTRVLPNDSLEVKNEN